MHCSPNNRKPVAAARIKVESPEASDISKGAITLNHEFESLKTTGNAEGKAMSCLSLSRKLASSPSPRPARLVQDPLRCHRWVLRLFRGSFPCRRRNSRYFAGSAPCHRWAHFLFSQDLPLVATKLRTSFARLAPLPPLGSMRLLRSLPRCGATHLSQSLPRWAGPHLVKTKNPTSLQLFFD